jgi:GNAT superfamily N-acetyltransferase
VEIDPIHLARVPFAEIVDLRYHVLRAGLPRDAAHFPGDYDSTTVHLAAKDGKAIVACATVLVNQWEGEIACQLRGMAVAQGYQRRGLGARLLGEIERVAAENGVGIIWANARTPAAGFYQKHGWEIVSEMFEIPTAGPHFKMVRRLK